MDTEDLEFSLEDIIKEFSDDVPETQPEEIGEIGEDIETAEPEPRAEETEEAEAPEESGEAEVSEVTEETEKPESQAEEVQQSEESGSASATEETDTQSEEAPPVTGDTIRMKGVRFGKVQTQLAQPIQEEETPQEPETEPFTQDWEPEYEQPIAEYIPPRPILVHPRSRLKELKHKLTEGPEKLYYAMVERGVGKLQAAIFFCGLVALISAAATIMYATGFVSQDRVRFMVFVQFMAMLVSALLGFSRLWAGASDLIHGHFSLNTLLDFSFLLCCADGVMCLMEQRVPCCAAFSLQMTMSLWNAYEERTTVMGQLDTMRKAVRLDGVTAVADYYEGNTGLVRTEAEVEDFMDFYQQPPTMEKPTSIYAIISLCLSVALGVGGGVLYGVSAGIQVAAVTTLAALPASMFIAISRPLAVLEKRLHRIGAVLCGWHGIEGLSGKCVFPLGHEDICPTGSVRLNGVKYFSERTADEVIAYGSALVSANTGALSPIFEHLADSHSCIRYEVAEYRAYPGGISGEVNAEQVCVGTLPFLREMGIQMPEGIRVSQAVGVSIDGVLCGLFAISYEKTLSSAAGLTTLTGYRKLKALIETDDFMITESFLKGKFGVGSRRIVFPEPEDRPLLREKRPPEDTPALAISTAQGLAPFAYCVTGARAVRSAAKAGTILHMVCGGLGIAMMAALTVLGALELLTPANMLLYQLIWIVPGLLITEWTRSV